MWWCFERIIKIGWPGEGDSNPRRCYPHRFSRPAHSTALTSPDNEKVEEPPGFEPGIAALQAAALPLGDGSVYINKMANGGVTLDSNRGIAALQATALSLGYDSIYTI